MARVDCRRSSENTDNTVDSLHFFFFSPVHFLWPGDYPISNRVAVIHRLMCTCETGAQKPININFAVCYKKKKHQNYGPYPVEIRQTYANPFQFHQLVATSTAWRRTYGAVKECIEEIRHFLRCFLLFFRNQTKKSKRTKKKQLDEHRMTVTQSETNEIATRDKKQLTLVCIKQTEKKKIRFDVQRTLVPCGSLCSKKKTDWTTTDCILDKR